MRELFVIDKAGFDMSSSSDEVPGARLTSSLRPPGTPTGRGMRVSEALCEAALPLLGVDGACIAVLGATGGKELVYATDRVIAQLDELQFTLGEGPCIDAFRDRVPVLVADLEDATAFERWPGFSHEATQAGARATFAFPLQIGAVPIPFGVVEFYRAQPGALEDETLAAALLVVDDLVRAVLDDLTGAGQVTPTTERPEPMFGRSEVAQATGMISVQLGIAIPDALARLRARAFTEHRPILEVAADVLSRRVTFSVEP